MSQDDTPTSPRRRRARSRRAVALRAQPRPVTRLNRRTLAILVGGLSVAVLGATDLVAATAAARARASRPSFTTSIASRSPKGWMRCRRTYSKLPPAARPMCPSWGRRCRATSARPSSLRSSR